MKLPRFIRRRVYKILLKRAQNRKLFLCKAIRKIFPYLPIYRYPEIWNHRDNLGTCLVPFDNHTERTEYIKQALELVNQFK